MTRVLVVVRGGLCHHLVSDFVNWENWEFAPYWLDVDTDAYGVVVVLGCYDFAVAAVVVVFVVVVSAPTVSVILLELLIQT